MGWEELLEESTCLNFGSFLCVADVELSKKSLQKNSNMTAANLCHEKSQSLESSTAEAPLWTLKYFLLDSDFYGSAQIKMI